MIPDGSSSARLAAVDAHQVCEASEILAAIDSLTTHDDPTRRSGLVSAHDVAVEVAADSARREQAWSLVYHAYLRKGFTGPLDPPLWRDLHDALPGTTTYLLRHHGIAAATMTAFRDGPAGLPADAAFASELSALRQRGRRVCEFGRLANLHDGIGGSLVAALALFRYGFLHAKHMHHVDDLVLTVNPRHSAFYERRILCRVIGDARPLGKVAGAPAVLLHLDLRDAENRYRAAYGTDPCGLWHFFFDQQRIASHLRHLFLQARELDPLVVELHFGEAARAAAAAGDGLGLAVLDAWPNLARKAS